MHRHAPLIVATAAALAVTLLGACRDEPTAAAAPGAIRTQIDEDPAHGPNVARDLAALRRATAPFRDFHAAAAAGWSSKITSCMADPAAGGMGFHYGNVGLIDGAVQVDRPELLLYEPQPNGRLRLVAVEYVIPYTFRSRDGEPPVLFGRQFQQNDRFQLWGLHAWVWKQNPSGTFASWNPHVTCENTEDVDVAPMAH